MDSRRTHHAFWAKERGIERPKVRNGCFVANLKTLIY
jgi:hypothetical protein